jgi:DNA-binding PucR family transcriptional regulator
VYFDSGENMREAARRLHLANRTVAYRLEKIESLLGGPLDDASRRRLAVALLVRRLRGGTG